MPVLRSSIARLMLVVLSVSVGLATLRSQSDFWLGVLFAVVVAWGFWAVAKLVGARTARERRSALGFLAIMSASLFYGFGPWSDSATRGELPMDARSSATYVSSLLPTTKAFLTLMRYAKPSPRAEIRTLDSRGHVVMRISLAVPHGRAFVMEQFLHSFDRFIGDDIKFSSFNPDYAVRHVTVGNAIDVYLDACYLLGCLLIGSIIPFLLSMIGAIRATRPFSSTPAGGPGPNLALQRTRPAAALPGRIEGHSGGPVR